MSSTLHTLNRNNFWPHWKHVHMVMILIGWFHQLLTVKHMRHTKVGWKHSDKNSPTPMRTVVQLFLNVFNLNEVKSQCWKQIFQNYPQKSGQWDSKQRNKQEQSIANRTDSSLMHPRKALGPSSYIWRNDVRGKK